MSEKKTYKVRVKGIIQTVFYYDVEAESHAQAEDLACTLAHKAGMVEIERADALLAALAKEEGE